MSVREYQLRISLVFSGWVMGGVVFFNWVFSRWVIFEWIFSKPVMVGRVWSCFHFVYDPVQVKKLIIVLVVTIS